MACLLLRLPWTPVVHQSVPCQRHTQIRPLATPHRLPMTNRLSVALVHHSLHTQAETCGRPQNAMSPKNRTCSLLAESHDRPRMPARAEPLMCAPHLPSQHHFAAPVPDLLSPATRAKRMAAPRLTRTTPQPIVHARTPPALSSPLLTMAAATHLAATRPASRPRLHAPHLQTQHTLAQAALWVLLTAAHQAAAAAMLEAPWLSSSLLAETHTPLAASSAPPARRAHTTPMAPKDGAVSSWQLETAARVKAPSAK
jgi:hypothetical protein